MAEEMTDERRGAKKTFEENLKTLEALVAKMESGTMNLDEMIASFESGRKLAAACQTELDSIRQRIEKVTKEGGVEPAAF